MSSPGRIPECPRCGYDLDGQIAAWHPSGADADNASCPAAGTCPECGLDFEWRYILVEGLAAPTWFLETARARLLRRFFATACRVLRPVLFWKAVRLEVSPRPRRIMLYVLLPMLLLASVYAAVAVATIIGKHATSPGWVAANATGLTNSPWFEIQFGLNWYGQELLDTPLTIRRLMWFQVAIAMIFGPPLMLLCLPWTLATSKVRRAHILRAFAYAITPIFVLLLGGLAMHAAECMHTWTVTRTWNWPWYVRYGLFTPQRYHALASFWSLHWLLLLWWMLYWFAVLKFGWRMQDHRRVYLAIMVPALLLFLVLAMFVPGALVNLV